MSKPKFCTNCRHLYTSNQCVICTLSTTVIFYDDIGAPIAAVEGDYIPSIDEEQE